MKCGDCDLTGTAEVGQRPRFKHCAFLILFPCLCSPICALTASPVFCIPAWQKASCLSHTMCSLPAPRSSQSLSCSSSVPNSSSDITSPGNSSSPLRTLLSFPALPGPVFFCPFRWHNVFLFFHRSACRSLRAEPGLVLEQFPSLSSASQSEMCYQSGELMRSN